MSSVAPRVTYPGSNANANPNKQSISSSVVYYMWNKTNFVTLQLPDFMCENGFDKLHFHNIFMGKGFVFYVF